MVKLKSKSKPKTNPVFYSDALRLLLDGEPERYERVRSDPDSLELLTWNVFTSLDTHTDRAWLGYRLRAFGGAAVRAPIRLSLWTGRLREPLLTPSAAYLNWVRQRTRAAGADAGDLAAFEAPIEVPVRVESPDVLILIDTGLQSLRRGNGGRDRVVELIDAGLEQARRLSSQLALAFVYASGTQGAADLSGWINELRNPARLGEALPWRPRVPELLLREVSWQQLLRTWQSEVAYLRLAGQPVRAFLDHARGRGLL